MEFAGLHRDKEKCDDAVASWPDTPLPLRHLSCEGNRLGPVSGLHLLREIAASQFVRRTTMKPASVFFLSILFVAAPDLDVAQADDAAMAHQKQEIKVQAKILRRGDFIAFGFGSIWMMSGNHLGRFNPADNSTIDIPVEGAIGSYGGLQSERARFGYRTLGARPFLRSIHRRTGL
jgi:hypothetical protein